MEESVIYKNGNYLTIIKSGNYKFTKIRRTIKWDDNEFHPEFPDSIDLKISNKCSIGCPFCHESSVPNGKVFDLSRTIQVLNKLPKVGIEVAIGGGDIFDCYKEFIGLRNWLVDNSFLVRVTINERDLNRPEYNQLLEDCRGYSGLDHLGVGVSVVSSKPPFDKISNITRGNFVFHVIIGITPISVLRDLIKCINESIYSTKILVLGFKNYGRGKSFNIDPKLVDDWKKEIKSILYYRPFGETLCLSFDNLAIEQLGIKDALLEYEWETCYQGDEFTNTMYINAVDEFFAPTSYSTEKKSWSECNNDIIKYFNENHN